MRTDQRFRPHEHLRLPSDFRRVYERRRSASDGRLIVYVCENELPYSRLGLSVSRKYGGAVQRNRLRRRYREVYRKTRVQLPTGLDIVLLPRGRELPTFEDLQTSLIELMGAIVRRLERERKRS